MSSKQCSKTFPIVSIRHLTEKYNKIGGANAKDLHSDPAIKGILTELTNAFTEWGFVYLTDHGIETESVFDVSKKFFTKEDSFKRQYVRQSNTENFGYVPFKLETFEKSRPFDLKEAFNLDLAALENLTDDKYSGISDFIETGKKFSSDCKNLTELLLRVLSPAVDPTNEEFLLDKHRHIGNVECPTILRLLWYPCVEDPDAITADQLRCGEHSDYGTITLLFQDSVGGLQVVSPSGEYINATPIPGSIVVNIGDMLQHWTSGRFKSTRHRVQVNQHAVPRQSLAYFVHPDKTVDVAGVDGSEKYPPINSYQYLMNKFSDTY